MAKNTGGERVRKARIVTMMFVRIEWIKTHEQGRSILFCVFEVYFFSDTLLFMDFVFCFSVIFPICFNYYIIVYFGFPYFARG